jgi:shikimate dehydrogenase
VSARFGPTPLAAVIGSPIAHSLSPTIHRAGFEQVAPGWSYVAFEVEPGSGALAVDAVRALGIAGLSVTMPHKEVVAAAVDRLHVSAATLEAVNTVGWDGDDIVGWSTDGDGFVASLAEHGVAVSDAKVVVFGAGGAARSVVDALARAGASDISIVNRTSARARSAAELAESARVGSPRDARTADIVVNATSLGMGVEAPAVTPAGMPSDPDDFGPRQVVADLVYHPLETGWLAAARRRGALTVDGLGMLVHQAALQQEIWTGRRPDAALMRSAAERELERRRNG